jgi:cytochrome c556
VRNKRSPIYAGMLGIGIVTTTIASAQDQVEKIIRDRIAHYNEIGAAYKRIGDELKSGRPDVPRIQESAQLIKNRGADMLHWFPPGSEPPPEPPKSWLDTILGWFSSKANPQIPDDEESHAKLAVWMQRPRFEELHGQFETEADRMWQIAQGGQAVAISAQLRRLGETCKSCHDIYREKLD